MRNFKQLIILLLLTQSFLFGTILNTKHNLSISGAGTIKATSETEVCVFCHIPHATQEGTPLWNRSMPSSAYKMYESDYLNRLNYPKPISLGATKGAPGSISRQCLSCHDGTIAIGSVYLVRGNLLGDTLINIGGVNADGTMSESSLGHIGTDLSLHHPVGYEYDSSFTKNFGQGLRTSELKATPDAPIKLKQYAGKQYVECTSCHDPHTENAKFLRVHSGSSHGQNVKNTCTSCHQKNEWIGSAHDSATDLYSDPAVATKYGTNSVSALGCINCHTPHNGEGSAYLLRKIEQNTCFQGAAGSVSTAACHGVGGAKDIESVLLRSYGHPVIQIDGVHTNLDTLYGTGVSRDPVGSKGISWDDSKHAECMDCHNPHKAQAGTHTPADQWYPVTPTNLVSNTLKGVSGVEPNWTPRGTQPRTFTTLESSAKEYQICLKCHSYWALGDASNGVSSHFSLSSGINITDQAWEFNPNNRSAHPVVMPLNQMTGNYAPKALDVSQMKPPWTNVGNQTMYCSDCHGADNEIGGDPKGPHGSNHKFMLKGDNNYWPLKPDGTYYTVWGDIQFNTNDANDGLFCRNCHNIYVDNPNASSHRHTFGGMSGPCVNCHIAVPHGSPISNLLGYRTFPEPYNYRDETTGELMLKMDGYKKIGPNYATTDAKKAYSTHPTCSGGSTHAAFCHAIDAGGYENYP